MYIFPDMIQELFPDIIQKLCTLSLQVLQGLQLDLHNLTRQVDSIPVSEYHDRMNTVTDGMITLHNSTCVLSVQQLQALRNRSAAMFVL